jgi:hypothetical protein
MPRRDYAGNTMGFRLVRGCEPGLIFDHFRHRASVEGRFPELESKFNCALEPSSTIRERSTLQSAIATFARNVSRYGDTYYLVVRCAGGWAAEIGRQSFAAVEEIAHEAEI